VVVLLLLDIGRRGLAFAGEGRGAKFVLQLDASDGVEPWRAFLRPSRATGNKVLESESHTQAEELGVVVKEVGLAGLGGWREVGREVCDVMLAMAEAVSAGFSELLSRGRKRFSRIRESRELRNPNSN
jgi:hypothetical protein